MKTTHQSTIERGILTSAYKQEIKNNIRNAQLETLSNLRDKVNAYHQKIQNNLITTIQLSVFSLILVLVIF